MRLKVINQISTDFGAPVFASQGTVSGTVVQMKAGEMVSIQCVAVSDLTPQTKFFQASDVNVATDTVHIPNHQYLSGSEITLNGSGLGLAAPSGLQLGVNYWMIAVDANNLAFASAFDAALSGAKIDLFDQGSGNLELDGGSGNTEFTVFGSHDQINWINLWSSDLSAGQSDCFKANWDLLGFDFFSDNGLLEYYLVVVKMNGTAVFDVDATIVTKGFDGIQVIEVVEQTITGVVTSATGDIFTLDGARAFSAVVSVTDTTPSNPTFAASSVNVTGDVVTISSHGLQTGLACSVTSTGTTPSGIVADQRYWLINVDSDHVAFATSSSAAQAGTKINILSQGAGVDTVHLVAADAVDIKLLVSGDASNFSEAGTQTNVDAGDHGVFQRWPSEFLYYRLVALGSTGQSTVRVKLLSKGFS